MIQKELWIPKVQDLLYPDNAYFKYAVNDSAFIEGRSVHVPVAGALTAERDRSTLPASIGSRTDVDVTYLNHEYSADPVVVTSIEDTEDSYDKLTSVTSQMGRVLFKQIGDWTAYEWAKGLTANATGSTLTFSDILAAAQAFNLADVPMEGRKLLVDANAYADLINLPEFHYEPALMNNVLAKGSVGFIGGFEVFMRSTVLNITNTGAINDPATGGGTEKALLFYHPDLVRFSLGNVELFADEKNPAYYGTVVSSLVRSGATRTFTAGTGVYVLATA